MEIVRDNKLLKFARATGSVKSIFQGALETAHAKGWTKVIIIGERDDKGSYLTSRMSDKSVVYMLERVKKDFI